MNDPPREGGAAVLCGGCDDGASRVDPGPPVREGGPAGCLEGGPERPRGGFEAALEAGPGLPGPCAGARVSTEGGPEGA